MTDRTALKGLLDSIRLVYGYDFTEYSEASLGRRVAHFMKNRDIPGIRELARSVLRDEGFFEQFVQEVTVTVTEMFRAPGFYKSLREKVRARLATYPMIRVWIAGCATGEEVYSMAILLREEGLLERTVIYATDINQRSLQTAREGIFPIGHMAAYTANYLQSGGKRSFSDYYLAKYDGALMDKTLRQAIVFSAHNLTTDQSFNEFQLILCRNVLIYFNQNLQNKVIRLFYESLCPFGILALGNKESLLFSDKGDKYKTMDKKERIFIKQP
ncbi:MAG TPA: protein-glutamate O-methyltransferase CheR [Puia sp.]|jgi:chemotaxis protein methyltransferase CheR|nr:protein-glutamate O-methyltransferase CheR [Puia sp.]